MPNSDNTPDPDDTAFDIDSSELGEDLELAAEEDDGDSYVWDAGPARPAPAAEPRAGDSPSGSNSGADASSGSASGFDTRVINRQAAEELGLGWMDDDELRDLSPSMRGLGEDELLLIKKQRQSEIKKQISSAGGQFVIGLLVWLITVAAIVLVATNWSNNAYLIPAAVIAPFGLWYSFSRWKRWIGAAPYCYRLMSSLGEDAENLRADHAMRQMRKATKQMKKHSNR